MSVMWNRKQLKFQKNIAMHVIEALPYDAVLRSAKGTQVYCHPSKETEVRAFLESLLRDLGFYETYPATVKKIMDKYPRTA